MGKTHLGHITLIGMPTAGKTKVGRKLAQHLRCEFVDIDDVIVAECEAKSLQEIVDRLSATQFSALEEAAAIRTVCALKKRTVIATGGSMIYSERAMEALQRYSQIIHLHSSLETVERRLSKNPDRGIVFAPGETIKHLYARRMPLYAKWAHDTVCTDGKRAEVARKLAESLS